MRRFNNPTWAGAVALNKTTFKPVENPSQPSLAGSSAPQNKGKSVALSTNEATHDEESEPEAPVVPRKRRARVVQSDDEEEDIDDHPNPKRRHRDRSTALSRPAPSTTPDRESEDVAVPWLITKLDRLIVTLKDADRKAAGLSKLYDKCLKLYHELSPFADLEAAYIRCVNLLADGFSTHVNLLYISFLDFGTVDIRVLGRKLCPINKLAEFDADPALFCRNVLERKKGYRFNSKRLPTFLYDEALHKPGDIRSGLFMSPFFGDCLKLLYTGPLSVSERLGNSGNAQGHESLADHYKIYCFTAECLIYVASIMRVLLSPQSKFQDQDGSWVGAEFVNVLLHIFYRPANHAWANGIIAHWNRQVFGHGEESNNGSDCEADLLLRSESSRADDLEPRRSAASKDLIDDDSDRGDHRNSGVSIVLLLVY
ncbi:hypothetical protein L226DRAFT_576356 [Lentinus tigrinus ALCF2SS1-7]|uniref:Uncharacterized protein n=1 Tax=Lentinus tigrinus ALCF2SS1-6 TaxID=1328759 RepID=A0A5C2RR28_9APHY|nr:hypothetical protein L227DRAFT_617102 [Lentinus tigrinus ALCF2SS1-6]RPD68463.1 hypothetical protein L226DRAFT_576356 [Lentinus tigrinus ALCF2SS1-7]